jgi:uncharacterized protein (TIGR00290 family)
MSWSSGKDSTFALQSLDRDVTVTTLLVTVNEVADRVAMHAVRRSLLECQADRLGLPLHVVPLPAPCPNDVYEARMTRAIDVAKDDGIGAMVFGDLFLEDVRQYREEALAASGMVPLFPLWSRPTAELARAMISQGVRAVLTCVDPSKVPPSFVGRAFDEDLLNELPPGVDPCGERGEFHTFVWDAPMFSAPIPIRTGERVERDGFVFCDVLPAEGEPAATDGPI